MSGFVRVVVVLVALLKACENTNLELHDSNHGLLDGYSHNVPDIQELSPPAAIRNSNRESTNKDALNFLKFEPAFLDFKMRPLGIPFLQKVTLFNTDNNRSIDMKSISGNTAHFHSSFFEDKRIPPLGNTTFNVVFLGRDEGRMESDLLIQTTKGRYKYKVKGASLSSSYRLRPIVGIKLPQNTTFSPLIFLYNPHIEPIQVTEVYSTGDSFHLELPTGANGGPKNIWEIPPLQAKAIIRIKFQSQIEQNHTAYIRFKLNNTDSILTVPLEVEVSSRVSLYSPQGYLDFGVAGNLDAPKTLNLYLSNPSSKSVKIDRITSSSQSIQIKYESLSVGHDSLLNEQGTKVATVTLDWKSAFNNNEISGSILVTYNNGQMQSSIPFYASIIEGNAIHEPSTLTYFVNENPKLMKTKHLYVKNNFSVPLVITNITLPVEVEKYFYTSGFKTIILNPQEKANVLTLNLRNDVQVQMLKLNYFILLKTNATMIKVPLMSYNGKLHVEFPYKNKDGLMDLGLLGIDIKKEVYFVVNNFNSAVININKISTSLPDSEVEIIHCSRGNYTYSIINNLSYSLNPCTVLKLDEFAILRLTLQSPYMDGQVWGTVLVETQHENLTIPVHYKVAQGILEVMPDNLRFEDCFPGKTCSHPLRIRSTFNDPMIIENIGCIPPDPRLSSQHSGHIMGRSTKTVGHLYFNPASVCQDECYLGLNVVDNVGWLHTMMLPSITPDLDLKLLTILHNRYLNETENGLKRHQNLTVKLDTSEVKWHTFDTSVNMIWPSLILGGPIISFPLTQIGNVTYLNVTLINPSDHNLLIQLVLSSNYPEFHKVNEGAPSHFMLNTMYEELTLSSAFFFNEKLFLYRVLFKSLTGLDTHESTLPILLPPRTNISFSLGFDAEDHGFNTDYLYVRNNLTVVEILHLSARSVVPIFKFGNRRTTSDLPLLFEMGEKQLKACEKKRQGSSFSMRRSFTARNLGDIPILIRGYYINGLPCEGFGFKVLNCESFLLPPNSSRRIEIGFTPDFTLTKLLRALTIETSLSHRVSYTLLATIPPAYLLPCSLAIERPLWEPYLFYVSLGAMCLLLVFVIGMIIIDSEQCLKASLNSISRANAAIQPPLDLRQVGAQTRYDIRSTQSKPEIPLDEPPKPEENTAESDVKHEDVPCVVVPGRHCVLVPTTGKSKKKFKEDDEIDENKEKRKQSWLEAHKLKHKPTKEAKRNNASLNKKDKKPEVIKQEEEEACSVSTDSNNEETVGTTAKRVEIGGKPVVSMTFKPRNRLLKKICLEEPPDFQQHIRKSLNKSLHKMNEKDRNAEDDVKRKLIKTNASKEYIEKRKRKLSEKKLAVKSVAETNQTPFTIWGDKANDPASFAQPSYEAPIEQQPVADLGPIGSRKADNGKERQFDYCNSFFSNNYEPSTNWDHVVQSYSPKRNIPPSNADNALVSGIWKSANNSISQNPADSYSAPFSQENGNYLWGSSSVWKPWEPSEQPKPRPRTPPGFANPSTSDSRETLRNNQNYDLFGMSNIWAKQYPNPWNTEPDKN